MLDIPAKEIFIFSEGSIREDRCRKDSSRERPTEGSRTEGYRIRFLFPHVDVSSARNRNLRIRKQEKNMCCVCLILRSSCDTRIIMSMIFYKNNRESWVSQILFLGWASLAYTNSTVQWGQQVGRFGSYSHRGEVVKISGLIPISTVLNSRVRTERQLRLVSSSLD